MREDQLLAIIAEAKKGATYKAKWQSNIKVAKKHGVSITKVTEGYTRIGIIHDNKKAVIIRKEEAGTTGITAALPSKKDNPESWVLFPYYMKNETGELKVRINSVNLPTLKGKVKQTFIIKDNETGAESIVDKATLMSMNIVAPSYWVHSGPNDGTFGIALENLISITLPAPKPRRKYHRISHRKRG